MAKKKIKTSKEAIILLRNNLDFQQKLLADIQMLARREGNLELAEKIRLISKLVLNKNDLDDFLYL